MGFMAGALASVGSAIGSATGSAIGSVGSAIGSVGSAMGSVGSAVGIAGKSLLANAWNGQNSVANSNTQQDTQTASQSIKDSPEYKAGAIAAEELAGEKMPQMKMQNMNAQAPTEGQPVMYNAESELNKLRSAMNR